MMQKTVTIDVEDIIYEMCAEPEFGMDIIASFLKEVDVDDFAVDGVANKFHEDAALGLRLLADAIEETMKPD